MLNSLAIKVLKVVIPKPVKKEKDAERMALQKADHDRLIEQTLAVI
jgi:hypothetical protein